MDNEIMVQNHELAAAASAATAKAEIECAYIMALRKPRNIDDARTKIIAACKRPVFAGMVEYSKPIGKSKITGPSIRFVEVALQAMRNIRTAVTVIYEDDKIRKVSVSVTDLESNLPYGGEIVIQKTVERKYLKKDQKPISERLNSQGEKTYLVEATEDDMATKQGALVSKLIRTLGSRLIPRDIIEEAMEAAAETRQKNLGDPEKAKRQIMDAFAGLGILPSMIEQYLGKKIEQVLPRDLEDLRKVYTSINTGENVWSDYVADAQTVEPEKPLSVKDKLDAKKKPVTLTDPQKAVEALGNLGVRATARFSDKKLHELTEVECCMVLDLAAKIEQEDKEETEK